MLSRLKNLFPPHVTQEPPLSLNSDSDCLRSRLSEIQSEIDTLREALSVEEELHTSLIRFTESPKSIKQIFLSLMRCLDQQVQSNLALQALAEQGHATQNTQLHLVQELQFESSILSRSFDDFVVRLKQIEKLAKDLENLTEHIHITSLNASVEAHQAKTSGSGFAVLAQEFRLLASRSQQLSSSVREVTDAVIEDAENLSHRFHAILQAVEQIEELADSIGDGAKHLDSQSNKIGEGLKFSMLCCKVGVACLEEMELKRLVYSSMVHRYPVISPAEFPNETDCPLGQWYREPSVRSAFGHSPAFRSLQSPHENTHNFGKSVMIHLAHHDYSAALNSLVNMENESLVVLKGLSQILKDGAMVFLTDPQ
ncbi:MAG: CZB domain-containing protein [Candidatus Cloacimonetes bacterium]|nr:CZB domain-containing protein [Candidatus Cloacimonadota bacterium]